MNDLTVQNPMPLAPTRSSSIEAAKAEAIATVQARYVLAIQRPRDIDDVRTRLLKECSRRGFAEVAMWSRAVGRMQDEDGNWIDKIAEGPSIRFVEAALRNYGNVDVVTRIVRDDDEARTVSVEVVDLETNYAQTREATVRKLVERKKLRHNEVAIARRMNSRNEEVFVCIASKDETDRDANAAASKALRVSGLRILPGDVVEECVAKVRATLQKQAADDPDGERKRIADAFSSLNVKPSDLKVYLGHPLEQSTPAELVHLRGLYGALKDGDLTWREIAATREETVDAAKKPNGGSKLDEVLARRAQKDARASGPEPAAREGTDVRREGSDAAHAPAASSSVPVALPSSGSASGGSEPSKAQRAPRKPRASAENVQVSGSEDAAARKDAVAPPSDAVGQVSPEPAPGSVGAPDPAHAPTAAARALVDFAEGRTPASSAPTPMPVSPTASTEPAPVAATPAEPKGPPCRNISCTEPAAPGCDGLCEAHFRLRPGFGAEAKNGDGNG